jgi:hypothetical protein
VIRDQKGVIARNEVTKQSSVFSMRIFLDCLASLAMTPFGFTRSREEKM